MHFNIKIGGVSICVNHRYDYIKNLCKDYITDEQPDFSVAATDEQIKTEYALMKNMFPVQLCECTCLHREIVKKIVKYGIILIHSAVIAVDGVAYVFAAKSGVGKSTHVKLWKELFKNRAVIVNGDKPMFSFENDIFTVHGSPWCGKEGYGENISMPVGSICFLERGEDNYVEKATRTDIINKLFHQMLMPDNAEDLDIFMNIIERIIETVPFYKLKCNMDPKAAAVSYDGIKRKIPQSEL